MPNINIEIDEELHKQAKLCCLLTDKSLKDYITDAIEEKLGKRQN